MVTRSLQFDHSDILGDIRKDIATAQDSSHRQQLLNWLSKSVPDPSFEHNYALKRYEEATGSWLLDGNALKEWLITPNSFLGIYGNGKFTTLFKTCRNLNLKQLGLGNLPCGVFISFYFAL